MWIALSLLLTRVPKTALISMSVALAHPSVMVTGPIRPVDPEDADSVEAGVPESLADVAAEPAAVEDAADVPGEDELELSPEPHAASEVDRSRAADAAASRERLREIMIRLLPFEVAPWARQGSEVWRCLAGTIPARSRPSSTWLVVSEVPGE
ncbi:hypothetical protein GCM10028781_14800 [Nostocoides australiense]